MTITSIWVPCLQHPLYLLPSISKEEIWLGAYAIGPGTLVTGAYFTSALGNSIAGITIPEAKLMNPPNCSLP